MKILFICRSFHNMAGGIERMASALMNEMCKRGHDVFLLTWDQKNATPFYKLDDRIQWHSLDMGTHKEKAGWLLRLKRAKKMRAIFKTIHPEAVMAFQHGTFLSARLYTTGINVPFIAAEREAPARFEHLKAGKWQSLIYQSFRLAKKITIQCESYKNDYPAYLRNKIVTISNPVFPAKSFATPQGEPGTRKQILCVGRLGYQKNQGVLIRAFARLSKEYPDWDLLLAGEGGDRACLEKDVNDLNLQNRVFMPGAIKDTSASYCKSHLFCLPARWEGFPNVIAEALSHGLPAIGFEGCAGTRDLIQDGINGLLARGNNDANSLAEALEKLMKDDSLRAEMGKNGIEAMKQYVPEKIFDQWETLFKETARS